MEGRTTPVRKVSEQASGIVKTVSPNGRIRGLPQRRELESHTIPFSFSREINSDYSERRCKS